MGKPNDYCHDLKSKELYHTESITKEANETIITSMKIILKTSIINVLSCFFYFRPLILINILFICILTVKSFGRLINFFF